MSTSNTDAIFTRVFVNGINEFCFYGSVHLYERFQLVQSFTE